MAAGAHVRVDLDHDPGHLLFVHGEVGELPRRVRDRNVTDRPRQAAQDGQLQVDAGHERLEVGDEPPGRKHAEQGRVQVRDVVRAQADRAASPAAALRQGRRAPHAQRQPKAQPEDQAPHRPGQARQEARAPPVPLHGPRRPERQVGDAGQQPRRQRARHEDRQERDSARARARRGDRALCPRLLRVHRCAAALRGERRASGQNGCGA
mmetsp:Transcript_23364/g.65148  ORF Transcript_23364/g.65148 Transcript_23364/m.65148 type:complete len:208 (-) Transcript_23364:2-625(-)